MLYAFRAVKYACKICKGDHYYLTNNHIVVTGTKEELTHANFPFTIVEYDPGKSDIKDCMNVFGQYPELDGYTRNGIARNVGNPLPMYSYGFKLHEIIVSESKNEVTITYRR